MDGTQSPINSAAFCSPLNHSTSLKMSEAIAANSISASEGDIFFSIF